MKKSVVFVVVFLLISMTAAQVANFVLEIKYNKTDRSSPFFGRTKIELPPFKYLEICNATNGYAESVFVQPGDDFCLWTKVDTKKFDWHVKSDTLFLEFKSIHGSDYDGTRPDFYLIAPHIDGVTVNKGFCKIIGWNIPNLNVQIGWKSGWLPEVMLDQNTIDSLTVKMKFDSSLKITDTNKIENKSIVKF